MYNSGLVAVIKVGGKVLREDQEKVYIPFGSEYSILLKNLKSQRVTVEIQVDGTDVFGGGQIVIPANSEVELERSIKNGNFNSGNKFKFIERTEKIEEYRGVKVDDGLIRIEYWTEKITVPVPVITYPIPQWPYKPYPHYPVNTRDLTGGTHTMSFDSFESSSVNCCASGGNTYSGNINYSSSVSQPNEAGITVDGSESNQKFTTAAWFPTHEQSDVIVIKLCGTKKEKQITTPILVSTKKICPTCGSRSQFNTKYCQECGTFLT
jgi:hypothetical protein